MADVNQVITLGVGTPSDVARYVLVGLSPNASVVDLDLCTTTTASLMPVRTSARLSPVRSSASLMPVRSTVAHCEDA